MIITPYNIFMFRLKNFIFLMFYIIFLFQFFLDSRIGNAQIDFLTESNNRIRQSFFLNNNFKNFFKKKDLFSVTENDLINDKRDLNFYLLFVLNNIVKRSHDNKDFSIGKFDQDEKNGFNIINSIKFTFKYTNFQEQTDDSRKISEKIYKEDNYPILKEFNDINEKNSYQKVKIKYLLDNPQYNFSRFKNKMFSIYTYDEAKNEERIYYEPSNDPTYFQGEIGDYRSQGINFYLNFKDLSRYEYDLIISELNKALLFLDNNAYLQMSINFYNPVFNIFIKIDFISEFSILGYNLNTAQINILDIAVSKSILNNLFTYSIIYCIIFVSKHFLNFIFWKFLEKKDPNDPDLINRNVFLWDTICVIVLILSLIWKTMAIEM